MPLPHAPHNAVIASNHRIHSNHSTTRCAAGALTATDTLSTLHSGRPRSRQGSTPPGSGQVVCAARSAALLSALSLRRPAGLPSAASGDPDSVIERCPQSEGG